VPRPALLKFKSAQCCGGLTDHLSASQEFIIQHYQASENSIDLMAAIGVNHVDYMSLDVHGAELPILKTIDFRELRIDLLTIECYDRNETVRQQMAKEISDLFAATGLYRNVEVTPGDLIVERLNITSTA
jgi:Methyltransferase FkbM domain